MVILVTVSVKFQGQFSYIHCYISVAVSEAVSVNVSVEDSVKFHWQCLRLIPTQFKLFFWSSCYDSFSVSVLVAVLVADQ